MDSGDSILAKILAGVGAALAALGTWAWHHTHKRIDDVNAKSDGALSKAEFNVLRAEALGERQRLREDVKELFSRDDHLKDFVNDKIDALREDMQEGFNRISDQIRAK